MPHSLPPRATAVLLALVLALLAFRLGTVPLLGPDEPRYTRVAVEMHRAGEWVTPTLQGEPWLEKPPLFYWLAGRRFAVLGETEAAARLPSVLAALLLVGATALFGARLYGSAGGPARRLRGRDVAPALRLRPRRVDGHAARGHGDAGDRPRRPAPARHRRAASRSWRPRPRPASRRSPRARSACCCPRSSLGGYAARDARVALAARDPLAGRDRGLRCSWPPPGTSRSCSTRAGTSWTSSS